MPYNVLLLPLLGGYVFITYWNHTRFDARRYTGERLLFHAALARLLFLSVAFVTTYAIAVARPRLAAAWKVFVPFPYSGTSLLAFLLGVTTWYPLNKWLNHKEREAEKAVEQWGDFLEILFTRAIQTTRQISVSLSSGKVYIGFVTKGIDPAFERRYIRLLPTLSGYRHNETRDLIITRDYTQVYSRLIRSDPTSLFEMAERFQLVIPTSEIVSANLFDPDVYEIFEATTTMTGTLVPAGNSP